MAQDTTPTVEDVFKHILEIEKELDLLEWKIGSEPVWEILRHGFCQNAFRVSGALENSKEPIEKQSLNNLQKIMLLLGIAKAILKNNLVSKSKPKPVAVFPFYRRNANNVDVHSKDLIQQLGERAFVFGVGEEDKKIPGKLHRAGISSLFAKLFSRSADRWISQNVTQKDFDLYAELVTRFEKKFAVKVVGQWESLPTKRLSSYISQSKGYGLLFKSLSFSSVFVVSAIQQGILGGARKAGIPLIELQHGSISVFHPMFNWPAGVGISNVPDEFWAWGESWVEGIQFANKTKPVIVGAGDVYESARNSNMNEEPGLVAFMSSADVTEKLFSCAMDCATQNPKMKFIYKAHPREKLETQVKLLNSRKDIKNLTILEKEYSALDTIKRSEFVVGVNSTTLFEAAGMGKKVAVIQVSGWEIAKGLIEAEGAVIYQPNVAAKKLKGTPKAKNPDFFYAKKVNVDLSKY